MNRRLARLREQIREDRERKGRIAEMNTFLRDYQSQNGSVNGFGDALYMLMLSKRWLREF